MYLTLKYLKGDELREYIPEDIGIPINVARYMF